MVTSSEGLNEIVSEIFPPMLMGVGCAVYYKGFAHSHLLAIVTGAIFCVASAAFSAYSRNFSEDTKKHTMVQKAGWCVYGASGVFLGGNIRSRNTKNVVLSALVGIVVLVTSSFLEIKKRKTNKVS